MDHKLQLPPTSVKNFFQRHEKKLQAIYITSNCRLVSRCTVPEIAGQGGAGRGQGMGLASGQGRAGTGTHTRIHAHIRGRERALARAHPPRGTHTHACAPGHACTRGRRCAYTHAQGRVWVRIRAGALRARKTLRRAPLTHYIRCQICFFLLCCVVWKQAVVLRTWTVVLTTDPYTPAAYTS